MGRLIDADIMKKAIIATREKTNSYADHVVCDFALKMLNAVRTEDAVKVVRCRNCQCWDKATVNKKGFLICPASGMEIMADDFCSYGERRSDE